MIFTICIIGAFILALCVNGLRQPKHFSVSRSISINRSPDAVFPLIEDLKSWDAWSPWAEKDPAMTKQFSEPSGGVGANYMWDGNKDVGKGRMTITDIIKQNSVSINLDIETPFEAHNQVLFSLRAENNGTVAIWQMSGPQNFMMRALSYFFNMDKMVGKDFETGLRSLKALVED